MKVTMPRKELHPVTTARIENSNTWGSLYFSPCPRRGSGTSASRPSNGENGGMATSDSVATPGVRHSPIRESPFLSAASVRSARVAVRTHFGPSVSVEQPCSAAILWSRGFRRTCGTTQSSDDSWNTASHFAFAYRVTSLGCPRIPGVLLGSRSDLPYRAVRKHLGAVGE